MGWLFLGGYAASVAVFIVTLGSVASSIAYGLMISLHATSLVFLQGFWLRETPFLKRLALALCTLFVVWGLVYAQLVRFSERHFAMPVKVGDRVIVLRHLNDPAVLKRGDWVAYQITEQLANEAWERRVNLHAGLCFDPVLALPGDRVQFTPQYILVNERPLPAQDFMPDSGEMVVPEKVWFIWPNLGIYRVGGVPRGDIATVLERAAMVRPEQMIGKPFKSWFGRRQSP